MNDEDRELKVISLESQWNFNTYYFKKNAMVPLWGRGYPRFPPHSEDPEFLFF